MKAYYQEELDHLRVLGARYAETHPAVAPLLALEGTDPDVERLLEGVAFLCGLINQRLDENFPEIIQGLINITAPQLLLPLPSQSLVQFTPLPHMGGSQRIEQGALLSSLPVDNMSCPFAVTRSMDILPAVVENVFLEQSQPNEATLRVVITSSCALAKWWPDTLTLYLHDQLARSTQWYMLLLQHTQSVSVVMDGKTTVLPPHALQSLPLREDDFNHEDTLLFSCFQTLRDYYTFPEKFLFLSLQGLNAVTPSLDKSRVELRFNLRGSFGLLPQCTSPFVTLNVVPVSNLFPHSADPFILSHTRQDYRLTPQGEQKRFAEIHSVRNVTGMTRGGDSRTFLPYTAFMHNTGATTASTHTKTPQNGTYVLRRTVSPVNQQIDYHLGLLHADMVDIQEHETLIAELACYHPALPLRLHIGDICNPTDSSPAMASFSNIVKPTPPIPPISDSDTLWQLYSHLQTNLLPLASAASLRRFLALYIPPHTYDPALMRLNQQRLDGIQHFAAVPDERLWKGRPLRGQSLNLVLNAEGFASQGELFLFGVILDSLLSQFTTINTYIRLNITNSQTGDVLQWPPRLGNRRLL